MSQKDLDAAKRQMDRTQARRIANQNGGGGFFASIGCGVIVLIAIGLVSGTFAEIIHYLV